MPAPSPVSPPCSQRSPASSSCQLDPYERPSLAPPSPPQIDELEPSPVYSPISSPSNTPKPPPSPPLAAYNDDEASYREKDCGRDRNKEKERPNNTTTTTTPPDTGGSSSSTSTQNADSIALRSALRLLMLQKERAKRDIVVLEEMREQALKDPVAFVEWVQMQKRASGKKSEVDKKDPSVKANPWFNKDIPKPQEIYRCPPIEWSQYGILGAPLEHLQESHRRRTSPSRSGTAPGVPQSMQTGGIIGMPPAGAIEFTDSLSGDALSLQGRMRIFETMAPQRGSVVGR